VVVVVVVIVIRRRNRRSTGTNPQNRIESPTPDSSSRNLSRKTSQIEISIGTDLNRTSSAASLSANPPVISSPIISSPIITPQNISPPINRPPVISSPVISSPNISPPINRPPVAARPAITRPELSQTGSSMKMEADNRSSFIGSSSMLGSVRMDELPAVGDYRTIARSAVSPPVVYGAPISAVRRAGKIPVVVEECVRYLEQNSLSEQGMLRLAGSSSETKNIRETFDRGEVPDFSVCKDINSVGDALKLYLRNLPQRLLIVTQGIKEASLLPDKDHMASIVRDELIRIPEVNYFTLKRVFGLMTALANNANVTLMSPDNLSIVFHPTLQIPPSIIVVLITHPHVVWAK